MRALRDFNTPKIVTEDTNIFMGLIGDLFPALDVPRKRDFEFEKQIRQATLDLKLQPEENFILKVSIIFVTSSIQSRMFIRCRNVRLINTGYTTSGVIRSTTFCFYNWLGWYG